MKWAEAGGREGITSIKAGDGVWPGVTDASLGLIQRGAWRHWVIIRASDEASRSFAITEKAPTRLNVKVISDRRFG